MTQCWQRDPKLRPTFAELTQDIDAIMESLQNNSDASNAHVSIPVTRGDDDVIEHSYLTGMSNDEIQLHTMRPEISRAYVNDSVIYKPPKN